jgi:AGCS family alanine or glycine:cation symporter
METLTNVIKQIDAWVWGIPLILLILLCGIWLTIRVRGLQVRRIGLALKFMVKNEEEGEGEVTSFGALCTALSATIGTGNIVGVATAIAAGGPGALFWMEIAALFGMATKYAEGFLAIKYRTVDKEGHYLGGPFYYIENGMGSRWKWLAKLFALFGVLACWASVRLPRSTALPLRQTTSLMPRASISHSHCLTQTIPGRQSSWG